MANSINKIILNWLPPADPNSPSFCLSILKSFLKKHDFDIEIIYWNLLFEKFSKTEEIPYSDVFPFIIEMNYRNNCNQAKIQAILGSNNPQEYINNESFHDFIENTHETLNNIINTVLHKYINQNIMLWGFSSKYYQWIPAAIIAESIKCLLPEAKIALGGMGTCWESETLLSLFKYFDFGVWGEGEYPLLKLCDYLLYNQSEFNSIPNLTINDNKNIRSNHLENSEFADLDQSGIPDYTDFFIQADGKVSPSNIYLPIESSRGCHWNRCKFCFLNDGYKYRIKENERLLIEIEQLKRRYSIDKYAFVDPDLIGSNIDRFRSLVKMLADLNKNNQWDICFEIAEINPNQIDEEIMATLYKAGLRNIQIGFEAISDSLLRKMNKKTTVTKNLFFIKHALENGLSIQGANIIVGIPDETYDDIIQSMDNLHYLRFFFDKRRFMLSFSPFALKGSSRYFNQLIENDKKLWCNNFLYDIFSIGKNLGDKKYDIFDFIAYKNKDWWDLFQKRLSYYLENTYSYQIKFDKDVCFYEEYLNNDIKKTIKLSLMSIDLLKLLEEKICSLTEIYKHLKAKNISLSKRILEGEIFNLKKEYLVYADTKLSEITSVISFESSICNTQYKNKE